MTTNNNGEIKKSSTEAKIPVCPFLKKRGDQTVRYGFPHASNRCFKPVMAQPIKLEYQKTICLTDAYCTMCEVYKAFAPLGLPSQALSRIPKTALKKKRLRITTYVMFPVILAVIFFLFRDFFPGREIKNSSLEISFQEPQLETTNQTVVQAGSSLQTDKISIPVTGMDVTSDESFQGFAMDLIRIGDDDSSVGLYLKNLPGWSATPVRTEKITDLIDNEQTRANIELLESFGPQYLEIP